MFDPHFSSWFSLLWFKILRRYLLFYYDDFVLQTIGFFVPRIVSESALVGLPNKVCPRLTINIYIYIYLFENVRFVRADDAPNRTSRFMVHNKCSWLEADRCCACVMHIHR